jgi:hypothetical protein
MSISDWDALLSTDWLAPVRPYLERALGPAAVIPMVYDARHDAVVLIVNDKIVLPYLRFAGAWTTPFDRQEYFREPETT